VSLLKLNKVPSKCLEEADLTIGLVGHAVANATPRHRSVRRTT
jgi:hypothetical protein